MSINKKFMLKKIGDEYSFIPLNGSNVEFTSIYNTNETGAFIYNLLKEGLLEEEILEKLCFEYDAPREVLKTDLVEFLEELKKRHIYE